MLSTFICVVEMLCSGDRNDYYMIFQYFPYISILPVEFSPSSQQLTKKKKEKTFDNAND